MKKWWNNTVFYQIYMPSFCDGNEDGIGDFKGIRSKLCYLKELGIGGIWLTPFYPSPKVDNGYDISDYYNIDKDYGTMKDFEDFIKEAHQVGIKVISDVVINHTSTKHRWFLESRKSKQNVKRDWYIWKEKKPNNWESFFGESAWEYDEKTEEYYYHSFAKEQVDLNWANSEVKQEIFKILEFWKEKGIDGFRLDVINNLTLQNFFLDNPIGEDGKQIHKYDVNQEGIHDVLKEIRQCLSPNDDFFLVGEISSDKLPIIYSYVGEQQLHTTFNFNLGSMEKFEFMKFYQEIEEMNHLYQENNYPTLFFGSHDMGRFPSRFDFSPIKIKAILTFMMTNKGIPFLYFGDEIGMKNLINKSVEDTKDIQGVIAYHKGIKEGKTKEQALIDLNEASRDKSRNTMRWNHEKYGGFSKHKPWIAEGTVEKTCNVAFQMKEKNSIWNYVKQLIQYRKEHIELQIGDCGISSPQKDVLLIERKWKEKCSHIVVNFSNEPFVKKITDNMHLDIVSGEVEYKKEENLIVLSNGISGIFQINE